MSYFVAISGPSASTLKPMRGRLVPASDAQDYFRAFEARIAEFSDGPVFLWDDAQSDTSDDLVCEACDEIQLLGKKVPESALAAMLCRCAAIGCCIHVWWPSDLQTGDLSALPVACSAAEALEMFVSQASRGANIGFVLQPNN